MGRDKISKNDAIKIANIFYSDHYFSLTGEVKDFTVISAEKSFLSSSTWEVCYSLISLEGNIIDGPVFISVNEDGEASFI